MWTNQKIDTLKKMWAADDTARVIGEAIGKSRDAVLGKADRLDLEPRKGFRKPKVIPDKLAIAKSGKMIVELMESEPIGEYLFDEIAGKAMCKWPCGVREGRQFWCGRATLHSYCDIHKTRVYSKAA